MRKLVNIGLALIFAFGATSCENLIDDGGDDNNNNGNLIENDITTNTTWKTGNTYILSGSIGVDNAVLTIEPGTTIKFETGASLHIGYYNNSTLIANGTTDKPIIFTSNAAIPSAGAWEGITFWENSLNCSMTYCKIEYAGKTSEGTVNLKNASIIFSNNEITNAKAYGIELDNTSYFTEMNSNSFSSCGNHPMRLCAAYMHTIGTNNTFNCADGYGVNITSGDATGTITWRNLDKPYYIEGEVDVDNSTLTIEPGAIFKFNNDGSLHFGYYNSTTLIANGTSNDKILFTSSATSPTAGAWNGVYFWSNTLSNTSITYCEVAYAGKSNNASVNVRGNASFTFNNNYVHHSAGIGIDMDEHSSFVDMNNNTVNNCALNAIEIYADNIRTVGTGNTLTCNAGYGIRIIGGDVTTPSTWGKQTVPYFINSGINIEADLTIEAGTNMKFGADGQIDVGYYNNAKLSAIGTSENPIVFTSSATSPAAGAWKGIELWSNNSPNTLFDYCEFNYAGKGTDSDRAAIWANTTSFTVTNSKIQYSNGYGIFLDNSTVTSSGNTFTSCALGNIGQN